MSASIGSVAGAQQGDVRFGILGPVLAESEGKIARIRAAKQRALLGTLLTRPNHMVSADELVQVLWDGQPPDRGRHTLRSHVMRLRQTLGGVLGSRVVTRPRGYLIELGDEELDSQVFESLHRQGRDAVRRGQWGSASRSLGCALALWRGDALADVDSAVLRLEGERLGQSRLAVLGERIDADLAAGSHESLVGELKYLVNVHPLREHFHAQLMRALYLSGRQAEALDAFLDVRRILVGHVGVEPGIELRELHQRILSGEPACPAVCDRSGAGVHRGPCTSETGRRPWAHNGTRSCYWTELRSPATAA